jgi:hypothetical protein
MLGAAMTEAERETEAVAQRAIDAMMSSTEELVGGIVDIIGVDATVQWLRDLAVFTEQTADCEGTA